MEDSRVDLPGQVSRGFLGFSARWRNGYAEDCKSFYTGSIPVRASTHDPQGRPSAMIQAYNRAYEIVNGAQRAPFVFLCDHASCRLPAAFRARLSPEVRQSHRAWDKGAASVTRLLASLTSGPALLARWSRLLVDLNRPPHSEACMPAWVDGVSIPPNQHLSETARQRRLRRYFHPYHRALEELLYHQCRGHQGRSEPPEHSPALVAVHSFTPALRGQPARPWEIGILWHRDEALASRLVRYFSKNHCVGANQPYSGFDVNYTLDRHAGSLRLPHVAIEIRQDLLYDAGDTGDTTGDTTENTKNTTGRQLNLAWARQIHEALQSRS